MKKGHPPFIEQLLILATELATENRPAITFLSRCRWQNRIQEMEPTAGFGPATRCLQIRRQLNSAPNFGFPCIRNASIWSQVFLRVGYRIGYSKPIPKLTALAPPMLFLGSFREAI